MLFSSFATFPIVELVLLLLPGFQARARVDKSSSGMQRRGVEKNNCFLFLRYLLVSKACKSDEEGKFDFPQVDFSNPLWDCWLFVFSPPILNRNKRVGSIRSHSCNVKGLDAPFSQYSRRAAAHASTLPRLSFARTALPTSPPAFTSWSSSPAAAPSSHAHRARARAPSRAAARPCPPSTRPT